MLINNKHKDFGKLELRDELGKVIRMVKSFNTKTQVAEIYITCEKTKDRMGIVAVDDGEPVFAKVHLPNAKLFKTKTGKQYVAK
jgi:hypothetical protein